MGTEMLEEMGLFRSTFQPDLTGRERPLLLRQRWRSLLPHLQSLYNSPVPEQRF